jgi:hypothetical protein
MLQFINRNFKGIPNVFNTKGCKRSIVLFVLSLFIQATSFAQTYLEVYGQNRVQLRKFNFDFFDTKHFRIYHYDKSGRNLARYVAEEAERHIMIIENKIGGQFPTKYSIVVFNNYDEFVQSNIGLNAESQIRQMQAGKIDFAGDIMQVYFTGNHADVRNQIREGLARVMVEKMMFGETTREIIKNAITLDLPAWVIDAYILYKVYDWEPTQETAWKNVLQENTQLPFNRIVEKYPKEAGLAFWKYLYDTYGSSISEDFLFSLKSEKGINAASKITLAQPITSVYKSVLTYFNEVYAKDAMLQKAIDSNRKKFDLALKNKNAVVKQVAVSSRGTDVAFVTYDRGVYSVNLQYANGNKAVRQLVSLGKLDFNEQQDPNYPIMTWSNTGLKLAILYKKKNQLRIKVYNSLKAKIENFVIKPKCFDRILNLSFMEDDNQLIVSAIKNCQSDLFVLTLKRSLVSQLTNDIWDDIEPVMLSGGDRKGIVFSSNRTAPNLVVQQEVNKMPTGFKNLFFYDTKTKRSNLLPLTNYKVGMVSQPIQFGKKQIAYLYNGSGVQNKYIIDFARDYKNYDSAVSFPITNYSKSIMFHGYSHTTDKVFEVVKNKQEHAIYAYPLPLITLKQLDTDIHKTTFFKNYQLDSLMEAARADVDGGDRIHNVALLKSGDIIYTGFEDAIAFEKELDSIKQKNKTTIDNTDSFFVKMKAEPYLLNFHADFVSAKMDNSILFNKYQTVATNGNSFSNPDLGAMLTASIKDVLENHQFTGGFRLPTNLAGFTYFLSYDNLKRRNDWGITGVRTASYFSYTKKYYQLNKDIFTYYVPQSVLLFTNNNLIGKSVSSLLQGYWNHPFDKIQSLRTSLGFRNDNLNYKASDSLSFLYTPASNTNWLTGKVEYVFDNSKTILKNIRLGYRYKFYVEFMNQLNGPKGKLWNVGFDFRAYQKIYRNIIYAVRLAGAHSYGDHKICYFLGGVDNQISSNFNTNTTISTTDNYMFQSLVTNLRGYNQNGRNGDTYALMNAEIRIPITNTLMAYPSKLDFVRNLQGILFCDAGSAWNGLLPDAINDSKIFNASANGVSTQFKIPWNGGLAVGMGAGLRTTLWGYYMRLDAAWNSDGGAKPVVYFSLGYDF